MGGVAASCAASELVFPSGEPGEALGNAANVLWSGGSGVEAGGGLLVSVSGAEDSTMMVVSVSGVQAGVVASSAAASAPCSDSEVWS